MKGFAIYADRIGSPTDGYRGRPDEGDSLATREQPDRSKINMSDPREVHCWTKHLNISKEELQKAVDKVGNSAAAVRKELAMD